MRPALVFFLKDNPVRILFSGAAFLILTQLLLVFLFLKPRPEPIILHYTTTLGVDYVGAWYLIYLLPVLSVVLSVLNFILAYAVHQKRRLVAYFLIGGNLFLVLLLTGQCLLILRLNS